MHVGVHVRATSVFFNCPDKYNKTCQKLEACRWVYQFERLINQPHVLRMLRRLGVYD